MATATKMRLTGILTNSYDNPLANAVIKFVCTSTYFDILNTVDTEYQITASGSYDFTVNYGTYTVQIRKAEDRNYSTVMSNVIVAAPGPWTIEDLIVQQPNISIINPDLVEQMSNILVKAEEAAALSKDWANKEEDQKVDASEYSSKHYSIKSSKSANAASTSASQANASKISAENANNSAQAAKNAAEAANSSAQNAKAAAETSASSALASKNAAAASEANALESKNASAASAASASKSKTDAETSALGASNSASSANSSNMGAQSAKTYAEAARDKAQKWADESIDVAVEPDKFSAKHWATKASGSATQADAAKVSAEAAKVVAEGARDQAVSANSSAQAAKTSSETARDQSVSAKTQSEAAKVASEVARDEAREAQRLAEQAAASTTGSIIENGNVDLSSGVAPTPIIINQIKRATLWKVTVGGVVDGIQYGVGDSIVYSAQTDSYFKIDSTDSVTSVAGKTGVVTLVKADVGLANVDNTSDANKPVSIAQSEALSTKVDKTTTVNGKALSNNIILSNTDVGAEPAGAVANGIKSLKEESDPFPIYMTSLELSASEVPFPDVWIPFNDGLQMLAGFGDYDRIYIGEKYLELPTRSAKFERNTSATYVDKSGILRIAEVNEPRFEKQGLLIEGQSTNLILLSEKYTDLYKFTETVGTTEAPLKGATPVNILEVNETGTTSNYIRFNQPTTGSITSPRTASCWVKPISTDLTVMIECEDTSPRTLLCKADVWTRVSTTRTDSINNLPIGFLDISIASPTAGQKIAVWGGQLEDLPFASSYIPTKGSATTRTADKCMVSSVSNISSDGRMSFSVYVDELHGARGNSSATVCPISYDANGHSRFVWFNTTDSSTGLCQHGSLRVGNYIYNSSAAIKFIPGIVALSNSGSSILALTGGNITKLDSQIVFSYTESVDITFGRRQVDGADGHMFGHIRDFRLWHSALSENQLRRLK